MLSAPGSTSSPPKEPVMKRRNGWAAVLAAALIGVCPQPGRAQAPRRAAPLVSPEVHPDGKVTFRLTAPKAEKVSVSSGEIQAVGGPGNKEMTKDDKGVWSVTVGPLPPGIYDYT